jgi:hypothetical protein
MVLLVALVVSIGITTPVGAGPVTVGNVNWYEFQFGTPIDFAVGCTSCTPSSGLNSVFANAPAWTFSGPAVFTVVDAFLEVDQFRVYDNAVLVGTTSAVAGTTLLSLSDPALALLNLDYSRGIFNFGAGAHAITIEHIVGQSGAAYFRVDSVPEPMTLLLLGFGLLGLAGTRKFK